MMGSPPLIGVPGPGVGQVALRLGGGAVGTVAAAARAHQLYPVLALVISWRPADGQQTVSPPPPPPGWYVGGLQVPPPCLIYDALMMRRACQ
jgi:hypothetical protein